MSSFYYPLQVYKNTKKNQYMRLNVWIMCLPSTHHTHSHTQTLRKQHTHTHTQHPLQFVLAAFNAVCSQGDASFPHFPLSLTTFYSTAYTLPLCLSLHSFGMFYEPASILYLICAVALTIWPAPLGLLLLFFFLWTAHTHLPSSRLTVAATRSRRTDRIR